MMMRPFPSFRGDQRYAQAGRKQGRKSPHISMIRFRYGADLLEETTVSSGFFVGGYDLAFSSAMRHDVAARRDIEAGREGDDHGPRI